MKTIGVIYHPEQANEVELADCIGRLLNEQSIAMWRGDAEDEESLRIAAPDLDILITLGGDGTIVRAVRATAMAGVPILGVNLGRLGFLAEVEPSRVLDVLPALLQGEYIIEERMMLNARLRRGDDILLETEGVNDAVVARGSVARMIHLSIEVDEHHVMTLRADGAIVSTPTGSTAYSLAAGGPIVSPDLHCLTLTPIAAHLSIGRAFVIPDHRRLRLCLIKGQGAMLTVDGQIDAMLEPGDMVEITSGKHTGRFVRLGSDGYFYETALRRLRWPGRGQNT
ncbi:MAG: NAD(+)/NADH kinase [Anaerolineae bacterium]|jgi:NAD+ kinase